MKPLLSVALISLAACVCTAAPAQKMPATASVPLQEIGYMPQQLFQLSGTCTGEMAPDKAVMIGGVSSGALKPTDAIDQLDKQLAAIRTYVESNHGHLELLERVRTLKNPPQQGREDTEPPFLVVQRLQADFPATAPVDAILQKLIELGLDRFGDNILNNYNRREAVVRFRVSDFDAKLHDMEQRCTADAWKQWCATPAASGCASSMPPAGLELQFFTVRSEESLLRPDGGTSANWQFSYNRAQRPPDAPDLLGNVTVHLDGNISLMYRPEAPKDAKP
jgi:uncharacterized protein YggE